MTHRTVSNVFLTPRLLRPAIDSCIFFSSRFVSNRNNDTPSQIASVIRESQTDQYPKKKEIPIVEDDEHLQPQWAALERRVLNKKTVSIGEGPQGRIGKKTTGWDHENV